MSVPRDELKAAIEARRELGPEHEDAVVDAFLARIEQRLETQKPAAAPARKSDDKPFVISLVSLGVAIPLLGIGGGIAGLAGLIIVCLALVAVNAIVWGVASERSR